MTSTEHIALVEDDLELARLTRMLLEGEGYEVSEIHRGDEAVEQIRTSQPDLIILDVMLPGKTGVDVCKEVRRFFHGPILMLTGRDDDITELASFKQGADDYVLKPVRPHILLARISALLRRASNPPVESVADNLQEIIMGEFALSILRRELKIAGQLIELTSSEFDVLNLLASAAGKIVSRDDCCSVLRGIDYDGLDRSIDMRISTLRKKLGDAKPPYKYIKTVRGKGYMLMTPS